MGESERRDLWAFMSGFCRSDVILTPCQRWTHRTCRSRMLCAHGVPFNVYDLFHYFEILVTFWTRGPPSASCLCCTHDKQGQGQQSGRHTDHHQLKVAGPKTSSREIIEDAEEGSPRRPSYCCFLPGTTLPTVATSQKHESNFGDVLKHRVDRTFLWEIRQLDGALKSRPQG